MNVSYDMENVPKHLGFVGCMSEGSSLIVSQDLLSPSQSQNRIELNIDIINMDHKTILINGLVSEVPIVHVVGSLFFDVISPDSSFDESVGAPIG